jgi:Spy/CpxP family protein refolding chaperone
LCAVGSAATLLLERTFERRPSLGDLADEAIERMRALELTEAQKSALAQIRDDWRNEVVTEESASLDRLDQAAANADAKVAALLTPEQALKYRELALAPRSK